MTAIHEPEPAATNDGIRQFGAPLASAGGADHRSVAHALVLDSDRILVVDDGVHCHLPGGPVPADDTLAALQEVVQATTGHRLVEATPFQRARRWTVDEQGRDVNEECHFFLATLDEHTTAPLPSGGTTRWAPRDAALDLMADEASRWVLSVALLATAITGRLGAGPEHGVP
jgi:hypothetical protein